MNTKQIIIMSNLPVSKNTNSFESTSWHGTTINTTPAKLMALADKLGAPYEAINDGEDKTNFDFEFRNSSNELFTVYDWKEYRPLGEDERVEFHIGGHNGSSTSQSKRDLMVALNSI